VGQYATDARPLGGSMLDGRVGHIVVTRGHVTLIGGRSIHRNR
jgi:hypothetical protein